MRSSDNGVRRNLIWLADVDSRGRRLHPDIGELVYARHSELARYRSEELGDDAQIATLIEEAAYRTSEVAYDRALNDPASYLFRTYQNLVDTTLRKTIRSLGLEHQVLSHLARCENPEDQILTNITRQRILQSMDDKGRELWERNLLGYTVNEIAAQEGQSGDYVGKRLRRAMQGAVRRLLLRDQGNNK